MMIKNAKDARKAIGSLVYWDDVGSRYVFERFGMLTDVFGRNLMIDGDWKYRPELTNLRTEK